MPDAEPLNLISIQPFYGGSHRAFIDGWVQHSQHQWEQIHLPARHWKWRMRQSAVFFSAQIDKLWLEGHRWDFIFTTDMLNAAEFRGLLTTPARNVPLCIYFHENQIAYPNRKTDPRDLHFAFTNLTSIMAADITWFNSEFNRSSLIHGLNEAAKHWPDYAPRELIESIPSRSTIVPPGIHVTSTPSGQVKKNTQAIHLVWAARWEHDKNPAGLLAILRKLDQHSIDFRLSVIGETFRQHPPEFDQIHSEFSTQIEHWGFQPDRDAYWNVLATADVFISTAQHEFYGLAVLEGLAAGLAAILPNRLAYPEIARRFQNTNNEIFLYEATDEFVSGLQDMVKRLPQIRARRNDTQNPPAALAARWSLRGPELDLTIKESLHGQEHNAV
ncbi:MAG: DUF3524 domain-containing protein [Mariniblastus sp.]|nr:DUF3524 domain-containing protein [Mariniblastus sp.]